MYYCNPVNLSYKYQNLQDASTMHREGADPSIVAFRDRYWLFVSMADGFWHSADLSNWEYVKGLPFSSTDYAPDVRVINDMLHVCASKRGANCAFYRTCDPISGKWEKVSDPFPFWDPNLFQDDDGRVYFYWGCASDEPIYGVEMDPDSLTPIGEPKNLIYGAPERHGWERPGENSQPGQGNQVEGLDSLKVSLNRPYIEGAWMDKHEGKYYLQYAAPGTNYNTYADGVYVAESPLGPFTYARHNPYCLKPGGFISGAGHGSTFRDKYGNWWHVSTMRVSVQHIFERRIGLFPAGFDVDGEMYCNTSFGDYPTRLAANEWNAWTDSSPGWMLLSYKKPVTASSALQGHSVEHAVDEDIRTYWSARSQDTKRWLQVDLAEICTVNAIQINFADSHCRPPGGQYQYTGHPFKRTIEHGEKLQYRLEGSTDADAWEVLFDRSKGDADLPHELIVFEEGTQLRYVRVTGLNMPFQGQFAVSGLRIFGKGSGNVPDPVEHCSIVRSDALTANLSWVPIRGAVGYNIRWGPSPDKLYSSWLVYDQTDLELGTLTANVDYWYSIDAFNENGVTEGRVRRLEQSAEQDI